jgi:hypothetical protein
MPDEPPDTHADPLDARRVYDAAKRQLDKLKPDDPLRPAAEAAVERRWSDTGRRCGRRRRNDGESAKTDAPCSCSQTFP